MSDLILAGNLDILYYYRHNTVHLALILPNTSLAHESLIKALSAIMSSHSHVPIPALDQLIDSVLAQLQIYKANFTTQVNSVFTRITPKDIIRLVIIAGAYCLLRPYLIKLGARFQARDHEREIDQDEIQAMRKSEGYNKGSLQSRVEIPDDTDGESGEEGSGTGLDWGKKARRRQRRVMRQLLEAEEQRRMDEEEAESDKELEQWMAG